MYEKPVTFSVHPQGLPDDAISAAAEEIQKGGLVIFPTSSFYALGASAFRPDALRRVFGVKKRSADKPLLVLIADRNQLSGLVTDVPNSAELLIRNFWPGQVTVVFRARPDLSPILTAHSGKIGVRLAGHPVAAALVKKCGVPISGTSANVSGATGCTALSELGKELKCQVDLILDAGTLAGGAPSTVVDATVDPVRILREGAIRGRRIYAVLEQR